MLRTRRMGRAVRLGLAMWLAGATGWAAGGLLREVYLEIPGSALNDLLSSAKYPNQPDLTNLVQSFESPEDFAEDYGQRVRGYVVAPTNGAYTFWVASDDASALYLSGSPAPGGKVEIANVPGYTSPRQWDAYASQRSAPVTLQAGQLYYVEALMKEGTGGDHLAVRWQLPNGVMEEPIPEGRLVPWGTPIVAPTILGQPGTQTVEEGRPAVFTVTVSNQTPIQYQWQRGGVDIAGATAASYTLPIVRLEDAGAAFRCRLSNSEGTVTSATAVLHVTPDRTPPVLVAAQTVATNVVQVFFSERLDAATATNAAHYSVVPGVTPRGARLGADAQSVLLEASGLVYDTVYVLTVNQVRDASVAGNVIAANSRIEFLSSEFAPVPVGAFQPVSAYTPVPGGADVAAAGTGLGGTSDQFQFSYQLRTGDFDVRVRVESLALVDVWSMAGLMARASVATNSAYAAAVATPSVSGISFVSRGTNGGMSRLGAFPVNFPQTWLRLQRRGDRFTGWAGTDGESWQVLGARTNAMPPTIFVGLAVASQVPGQTVRAAFRDFADVAAAAAVAPAPTLEPPGPSSRRTGLALTEIMYRPAPRADGLDLEFVEVFNALPVAAEVGGYRLSGSIDYEFPAGSTLVAGGYRVVARDPAAVRAVYGLTDVLGPYTNGLPGGQGRVRLEHALGAVLLDVAYGDRAPWPVAADGAGHSLVLARPSYGEGDPRAWAASFERGGSPGARDTQAPEALGGVVINEFLAHTDDPERDYIELYNRSARSVDISGAWLGDAVDGPFFRIPERPPLPPRGFVVFTQDQLGFALSSTGERILLLTADQRRVADAVRFDAQANGVASGRSPDGAPGFRELLAQTPGAPNAAHRVHDIVINELMYHPITGDADDEYVELFNRGGQAVSLGHWRFVDGIEYAFPADTVLPAGAYLLVARNTTRLLSNHPSLSPAQVYGDYQGELSNNGERVALARPSDPAAPFQDFVIVDEVTYGDGGRWGRWSDGGGSSLELVDPRADHQQAANWADSDESAKAPWTLVEFTGVLDLGSTAFPMDTLFLMLMDAGECLVDDVQVIGTEGAGYVPNPSFETDLGGWDATGTQGRSILELGEGYQSRQSLRVRASARGATDANNVRAPLFKPLAAGSFATLRAQVRWLCGSPEILLRLRGNALEAAGRMDVPGNLGTPGARNSRWRANAGPAVWDVRHAPVLPALNEPVQVSARVHDPDGIAQVRLRYHVDGAQTSSLVEMRDDGTGGDAVGGDGLWTGVLPAQSTTNLVAFSVVASDAAPGGQSAQFPPEAPARACLVRWGEAELPGNLPGYRIWMTRTTQEEWSNRHPSSNEPLGVTFAFGNYRVLYDAQALYSGSPFHWTGYNSPLGNNCNYLVQFAADNRFLGSTDFVLNLPSNLGSDRSFLREQLFFRLSDQMGRPSLHRRFVHLFLNGVRRGPVFEDIQQPNREVMEQWFPEDPDGELFKIEDWFEYDDTYFSFANVDATLENFMGADGTKKQARYRWTWRKRAVRDSAHDYRRLLLLADVLNAGDEATYVRQTRAWVDLEQWMRCMALRHIVGDWDAYGYRRGKNMFAYKPERGPWQLFDWDVSFAFGLGDGPTADVFDATHFDGTEDAVTQRMYQQPEMRRAYLRAVAEAVAGPLTRAAMSPWLEANVAALKANELAPQSPESILTWVDRRRTNLLAVLATNDATFQVTGGAGATLSGANLLTLTGTAPLAAQRLVFNDVPYPVTWTSVTGWTARVPLHSGANALRVVGLDRRGRALPATVSLTATYQGVDPRPEEVLVLTEIHYHPAAPDSGFVELHNKSANHTLDLSGYRLQGVDFVFAPGTLIEPGTFLVVASDRFGFSAAYGLEVPLAGVFNGRLQNNGEALRLLRPGTTPGQELVVDEVRYSDVAPWSTIADGQGASLQLQDVNADNRRAASWVAVAGNPGVAPGWQFASVTGVGSGSTFYLYLASSGDVFVDEFSLVEGTVPGQGVNLLKNPGFETALAPNWTVSASDPGTVLVTSNKFTGTACLHLVSSFGGNLLEPTLAQSGVGLVAGRTYTLSFWYLPTSSGGGMTAGLFGSGLERSFSLVPVASPPASSTPGRMNSVQSTLDPFPAVWINELQPTGAPSTRDAAGEADPWVELYNAGSSAVDLTGLFLTDDLEVPARWAFPAGASLPGGGFRVVWLDGQTAQHSADEWHASFRLTPGPGRIALTQNLGTANRVLDDLAFDALPATLLVGSFPDGDPLAREVLHVGTPGTPNSIAVPPAVVFINEWMAVNSSSWPDPADGLFDDWFELYNPGPTPVDLSGYWLSDDLSAPFNFVVPTGTTLPAGGFLLVWADNQTGQNGLGSGLHAGFRLSQDGEAIVLSGPDGRLVDAVMFGPQTADLTQGRFPDGGPVLGGWLAIPTPGQPNQYVEPGPGFTDLGFSAQGFTLTWSTQAGRGYQVEFKDHIADPAWQPLTGVLVATGTELSATDEDALAVDSRFYRVVELP